MKYLRVDDNLLHGSVAFSWVRNLKIHCIVVADDKVEKDEFLKMTLGIAKPPGVRLETLSMDQAIVFLRDIKLTDLNTLIIVRSVENARTIIVNFPEISSINIGMNRNVKDVVYKCNGASFDLETYQECCLLDNQGVVIEFRARYDDPIIYFEQREL